MGWFLVLCKREKHRSYNHWQLWIQKRSFVFCFESQKVVLCTLTCIWVLTSRSPLLLPHIPQKQHSNGFSLEADSPRWPFILFTLVSCTQLPDFCALRNSPLHCVLPQKANIHSHSCGRGVHSCTSAKQSLSQAMSVKQPAIKSEAVASQNFLFLLYERGCLKYLTLCTLINVL